MRRRFKRDLPFRKIVPNMITSGSVLCGFLALALCYYDRFLPAAWLVGVAVIFDYMDGRVARMLGGSSDFGVELDSLADALSFGAVPAFMTYSAYVGLEGGLIGALSGAFFTLCGVLRLARFNVTHVVGPFQGLPIPAAGLTLVSFVMGGIYIPWWAASALMAVLGGLMVSRVPYGNLKKVHRGDLNRLRATALLVTLGVVSVVLKERAPVVLCFTYVLSGPVGLDWGRWLVKKESVEAEGKI
ncbi:CDP-diacylglycerol--serine O-phosphatidyltransferase [Thermanaerovibrio acidaminovorans]|uniref:CDP-diacylglycerol--serine O-phosphatidyltransferase n=1 Tax=Thermanaerovibrio acidaminovorans (strain ATCC 49978 / DSM 6589 / Su883) TaxID=525903 RepID=D1B8A8_THEAS|nr:CDP-diacylglycerol--serine O-phosphatidyltransferase [Thermanaerovibrio acidaminovorans]ACZ18511.1 CDP-diacylglycerol/serineO-phosphatidyltransfera se [Thermanaerovibrio acidaminovorans DSM 6589]